MTRREAQQPPALNCTKLTKPLGKPQTARALSQSGLRHARKRAQLEAASCGRKVAI